MRTIISLLALCLAPAALQARTEARADILTGRVTDLAGKPVADAQVGGTPLALSMVVITGSSEASPSRDTEKASAVDATVPNPVAEMLGMMDTLHLSVVQIVGLTDVADTLQAKNGRIYRNIRALLSKSQEAGDITQMAGSVAMMLEEVSGNTARAVAAAEKLLRAEQWAILLQPLREPPESGSASTASSKQLR